MYRFEVYAIPFLALAWTATSVHAQKVDSADKRAEMLVQRMTFDEKLSLVHGTLGRTIWKTVPDEKRIGAGHVPGVERLGIPDLFETDASLGVVNPSERRKGDVATAMPSTLATASSFDPRLAYAGGAMIGAEARAKGFNVLLAGGADLIRDPWSGRNFEYMSEDVLLTGIMAGAAIDGVQSNHIVSTVKHYVLNSQETGRTVLNAKLDDRALRTSDLLAFELAIEKGHPGSVMCGYNRVNSAYNCENAPLLTDVLKQDWGYRGWVMSDWGAVHSTVPSALAGLDQESGEELDKAPYFGAPLKAAIEAGQVPAARLDDMVTRIVRSLAATGVLDHPAPLVAQPIDYDADAKVAQATEEAGIVLLRNQAALLPLAASARHILIVGGHADIGVLSGGGSSQVRAVGGPAAELPMPGGGPLSAFVKVTYDKSSPVDAIRARNPGARIDYLDGSDPKAAALAAAKADVVIVFAEQWRSEAIDLDTLALSPEQEATIDAVAAANPHTVLVLESGGAVAMPWLTKVGAVVEAWYPGQRGAQAITRVLFGDVNPSGRLPITFPTGIDQAPRPHPVGEALARAAIEAGKARGEKNPAGIVNSVPPFDVDYREGADVGYRWYARMGAKPLFPFGFGLSYTRFSVSGLKVVGGAKPVIEFSVTNKGARRGADATQIYADVALGGAPALPRLIGFSKVELDPGETTTVHVAIDRRLLDDFDESTNRWVSSGKPVKITVSDNVERPLLSGWLDGR